MKEQIALTGYVKAAHGFLDAVRKNTGDNATLVNTVLQKITRGNVEALDVNELSEARTRKALIAVGFDDRSSQFIHSQILINHGWANQNNFNDETTTTAIRTALAKKPLVAIDWEIKRLVDEIPEINVKLRDTLHDIQTALHVIDMTCSDIELRKEPSQQPKKALVMKDWANETIKDIDLEKKLGGIKSGPNVPPEVRKFALSVLKAANIHKMFDAINNLQGKGR